MSGRGEPGGPKRYVWKEQTSRGTSQREWIGIVEELGLQMVKGKKALYFSTTSERVTKLNGQSNVMKSAKKIQDEVGRDAELIYV